MPSVAVVPLPPSTYQGQPLISPLAVVGHRTMRKNGALVGQLLVQWKGLSLEDASWEDEANLIASYVSYLPTLRTRWCRMGWEMLGEQILPGELQREFDNL
ncbi:hypothetical protein Pint_36057 [Pistacia integerrima]|uniref:Uncharacterized protein n=1 Tax=Pistacia integerrima TaxID=434235 RepID=A0ACC0Y0G3_9ROSI|nr:hypothetical protein Pint_36057 [Pistacia integerrima]